MTFNQPALGSFGLDLRLLAPAPSVPDFVDFVDLAPAGRVDLLVALVFVFLTIGFVSPSPVVGAAEVAVLVFRGFRDSVVGAALAESLLFALVPIVIGVSDSATVVVLCPVGFVSAPPVIGPVLTRFLATCEFGLAADSTSFIRNVASVFADRVGFVIFVVVVVPSSSVFTSVVAFSVFISGETVVPIVPAPRGRFVEAGGAVVTSAFGFFGLPFVTSVFTVVVVPFDFFLRLNGLVCTSVQCGTLISYQPIPCRLPRVLCRNFGPAHAGLGACPRCLRLRRGIIV